MVSLEVIVFAWSSKAVVATTIIPHSCDQSTFSVNRHIVIQVLFGELAIHMFGQKLLLLIICNNTASMLVSTDLMGLGICPGPKTLTRDEGITIS
jgi:hypothetical protein